MNLPTITLPPHNDSHRFLCRWFGHAKAVKREFDHADDGSHREEWGCYRCGDVLIPSHSGERVLPVGSDS